MDAIEFTYTEILLGSKISTSSSSIEEICDEIGRHQDRYEKNLKDFLTTSLCEYSPVSRPNCQKIINISKKIITAAIKSYHNKTKFENKRVIFDIALVPSDDSDSDVSMTSVGSSMSTRSNTRQRGRPRSVTPKKPRGRQRSNSSSTSRDNSAKLEPNSYEIRSRGNSDLKEILESITLLEPEEHKNKKKRFKPFWFLLLVKSVEKGVSPRSLIAILELLKELQPVLISMDIPSESLLQQYKLAIPILNEVQIQSFIDAHTNFTLCYDESPSRYDKCLAVGLYSTDGNFLCIGVQQCSGNTGDTLLQVC